MAGKIIFWINDTDPILKGELPLYGIGGANVQMAFWAKCFAENGWQSFTFTRDSKNKGTGLYGIRYLYYPVLRYIGFIANYITGLFILLSIKPDFIITRAKVGELLYLSYLSKIFRYKLVHMLASDGDVIIANKKNKDTFQQALQRADFVVAQNTFQKDNFLLNFRPSEIPIIPNIWDNSADHFSGKTNKYDLLWVANFRDVKRPLWFVQLAEELPEFSFAMIGISQDDDLFNACKVKAHDLHNLTILGYKSLFEVTAILATSKALVCTSKFEGFPNTFLQAWSRQIPVVSTVDPSDIIGKEKLGIVAHDIETMKTGIKVLLLEKAFFDQVKKNILGYFEKNHSVDTNYHKLIKYIHSTNL